MASIFTSSIQSSVLSLLLSRLPLQPLDIPQQSSFTLKGDSGPSLHLTNITLDIDKLQSQYLPKSTPINIRHAFVEDLKILVNTNGIQIYFKGVNCVVSPKAGIENESMGFLNPSNSIILKSLEDPLEGFEGMMESVVGFVDAVSGVNSFTSNEKLNQGNNWGDEIDDEDDDKIPDSKTVKSLKNILENDLELNEDLQKNFQNIDNKSSNNSIVNYAIDFILSKISVNIENINIKIVADPIILNLKVDHITSNGDKADRKCTVNGVRLSVIKPKYKEDENLERENNYYEDNSKAEKDEEDYDDDLMSSSFMVESKADMQRSIVESAMYSTSGKSIYMSAIQGDFDSKIIQETNDTIDEDLGELLFIVDSISILLKARKDISIKFGNIKLSLINLPNLTSSFITLLIQISKQKTFRKTKLNPLNAHPSSSPSSSSSPSKSKSSNINLELFQLDDLQISLNSKLDFSGNFTDLTSYIFHLKEFILEKRSPTLIQGSLKMFEIFNDVNKNFHFINDTNNSEDVKIEISIEDNNYITSIVFEKSLVFKFEYKFLEILIDFYNKIDPIFEKIEELKIINLKKQRLNNLSMFSTRKSNIKSKPNKVNIEVSSRLNKITGSLEISKDKETISFKIAPIIYDSLKKLFNIDVIKIKINTVIGVSHLDINRILFTDHQNEPVKFTSYDVNLSKAVIKYTNKALNMDSINFHSSFKVLNKIIDIFQLIKAKFISLKDDSSKSVEKTVQFDNKSTSMRKPSNRLISSFYEKPKVIEFYSYIKSFTFSLFEINEKFGGIIGEFSNIGYSKSNEIQNQLSIMDISMNRLNGGHNEVIIKRGNKWDNFPMLFIKFESLINIFLNSILINYDGKWVSMFEQNNKNEDPIIKEIKTIRKKVDVEMNLFFTDINIGLKPVKLPSSLIIVINKANSDILIYNDKSTIIQLTSNLINLYLVDDVKNLNHKLRPQNIENLNIHSIWKNMGYIEIGKLNTILTKIKLNSKNLNSINSIIDIELNIEKIGLDLCCDSTQCFIQLLKDLKKPIYFSNDDKYKFKQDEEINVFQDLDLGYFEPSKQIILTRSTGLTGIEEAVEEEEEVEEEEGLSIENDLNIVEDFFDHVKEYSKTECTKVKTDKMIPLTLYLNISETNISLYDGYDWKETRLQIKKSFERISKLARNIKISMSEEQRGDDKEDPQIIFEERLYQSILVDVNMNDEELETIDFGKKMTRKAKLPFKLKRSKKHKILIKLEELDLEFILNSNNEPHLKSKPNNFIDDSFELVNDIRLNINNFQILDNVPTSSWNMFIGYMIENGDREIGKNMIKIDIQLIRPISQLAAIEMILNVSILPLRLFVDQDTLEFFTRFVEFKDKRFIPSNNNNNEDDDDEEEGEIGGDNEDIFIQKLTINRIKLKIDYKPKNVDYKGIRSGHTSEFVNFFTLDGSEITLNKVVIYGINGFKKLNQVLTNYWSPDIRNNQIIGILSGISPLKSIINISSSMNNLVKVNNEIGEFGDGKVTKNLKMNALELSKVTGGEILKIGVKLATGTQTILENTEELFGGVGKSSRVVRSRNGVMITNNGNDNNNVGRRRRSSVNSFDDEDENDYHKYFLRGENNKMRNSIMNQLKEYEDAIEEEDDEDGAKDEDGDGDDDDDYYYDDDNEEEEEEDINEQYTISLYSNQPTNLNSGLRTAYESIEKNYQITKKSIQKINRENNNHYNLIKITPIIIIRPIIAISEAVSKGLLGGVNNLNPAEGKIANEKYKRG